VCAYRCPGQQLYTFTKLKALEYETYEDIYTKHKHREEKTLKNIHEDNLLQYRLVVITMYCIQSNRLRNLDDISHGGNNLAPRRIDQPTFTPAN